MLRGKDDLHTTSRASPAAHLFGTEGPHLNFLPPYSCCHMDYDTDLDASGSSKLQDVAWRWDDIYVDLHTRLSELCSVTQREKQQAAIQVERRNEK